MKITVVYNQGIPFALDDEDTIKTAKEVANALDAQLFELDAASVRKLRNLDTDFFFNCAFGIGDAAKSEAEVAMLLEKTGKPFSGSDSKAIVLTNDKTATKEVLMAKDLPTPKFQILETCEKLDPSLRFPLIVKPNNEHSSVGITGSSVVSNIEELRNQLDLLEKSYHEAVFVEEYIDGRELNVTVLGNGETAEVLPVSEIIFGISFNDKFKVVDFAAKWEEDTVSYKETQGVSPAQLDDDVKKHIEDVSRQAFIITKCRDYARVDIRLSKDNIPYILEVNANPAIGPSDGATRSAKAAGYTYSQFLQKIIDVALARYQH